MFAGKVSRGADGLVAVLLLSVVLGAGCGRREESGTGREAVEVAIVAVSPTTVPVPITQVGQLQASRSVELRSRVQGFLVSRDFKEGGKVQEGQTLFVIDPQPFIANLEIAKAQLDQALATLAWSEREVERLGPLVEKNAASARELDDARTEQLRARANVNLARANVTKAELDYSYTTIKSPFSGVIGEAEKDVGALVDAGANSLLAKVTQLDPIYVTLTISEREGLLLSRGLRSGAVALPEGDKVAVSITMADGTPYGQSGTVNFVNPELDAQTGTARLRAEIANPDGRLVPGLFVNVKLSGFERRDAIVVPQRSVLQAPTGPIVYVIGPEEKVVPRPVTLGEWAGDQWVVLDGLNAGERVVTEGTLSVRPGMQVRIAAADRDAPGPPLLPADPATPALPTTNPVAASAR